MNLETKDLDQGKTFKSTFLKILNGKGALSTNVHDTRVPMYILSTRNAFVIIRWSWVMYQVVRNKSEP